MLVMISFCFWRCHDQSELTKTELLTSKDWLFVSEKVSPGKNIGGVTLTDLTDQHPACAKDNIVRYLNGNALNLDEGATKCNASDPQTLEGTWVFNADETNITLTITSYGVSYTEKVLELTENSLIISFTEIDNGTTYTHTVTYSKG